MGFFNKLKTLFKKNNKMSRSLIDGRAELARLEQMLEKNENDAETLNNIAELYLKDFDVGIDPPEAVKWFKKAAAKGYKESFWWLGYMHEKNYVFDPHRYGMFCPEEAFSWYKKGAITGCSNCQRIVAERYEKGEGVAKNPVQAYRWYAMSGDSKWMCEELRKEMTDNELKELRDLLAMCNISEDKN